MCIWLYEHLNAEDWRAFRTALIERGIQMTESVGDTKKVNWPKLSIPFFSSRNLAPTILPIYTYSNLANYFVYVYVYIYIVI